MTSTDRHLERWIVLHRVDWLDPVFVWLSRVGAQGAVFLALAALLALLWRRPTLFAQVLVADVVADVLAYSLRQAIDRPRPPSVFATPKALVRVPGDPSLPSGHSAAAFACATVLAWKLPRAAPALLLLAAGIAFSRVYVGVHYPADVLAGALLGVAVGLTVLRWRGAVPRRLPRVPRGARSRFRSRDRSPAGTRPGSRSGG